MGRPVTPPIKRFMAKVAMPDRLDGCWTWTAEIGHGGYGRFRVERTNGAHRFAYEYFVGPIPDGMHIDHLCRNRACVNPAHLEVVSPGANVLRGAGWAAQAIQQTHCIHGHEFSGYNVRLRPNGRRACRTCIRQQSLARYHRKRLKLAAGGAKLAESETA